MKYKHNCCPLMNGFLVLIIFFQSYSLFTQTNFNVTIKWDAPTTIVKNEKTQHFPNFNNLLYANGTVFYQYLKIVDKNTKGSLKIGEYTTSAALKKELDFLRNNNITITETPTWVGNITNGAGKRLMIFSIVPFVKKNGTIQRITSFSFNKINHQPNVSNQLKSFATESVLKPGSGEWYKIAVHEDGIYKLDYDFLDNMGINVSNINPQHIHIYGNGDGRLPDLNSAPRTDDLVMNAIHIEGGSDGIFNQGDYILFYAKGPHRWELDATNNLFYNVRNIYSDVSCYFVNINPNIAPLRVQSVNSSTSTATNQVISYNLRAVHEKDLSNVTKSGQRWYGEKFDVQLAHTINFDVNNPVINEPSTIKISTSSSSLSSSSGSFTYKVNGTTLLSPPLPSNGDGYYGRLESVLNFNNSNATVAVNLTMARNNPSIVGYLDKIELNTRRKLYLAHDQFDFRDLASVGVGNVSDFTISNFPTSGFIWDVTDKTNPVKIIGTQAGSTYTIRTNTDVLREFVASNGVGFKSPIFIAQIANQNLHALSQVNYLIISPTPFISQANRLADLHRANGLSVHVVDVNQIYNEFSSGSVDAAAIRTFIKMFYDRNSASTDSIKYVCLFGDGTYDPKNRVSGNNNFIPTYQLIGSSGAFSNESPINNILADDFYGILDDAEAMGPNSIVDVGVGRLLISSTQIATEQINKIEHYMKGNSNFFIDNNVNCVDGISSSSFGDWRTKMVNVGDLEDYFVMTDLEPSYNHIKTNHPEINVDKLYLDAYQVESTVAGKRFPELEKNLMHSFNSGSLLINYVGHGGVFQLSESRILTTESIRELSNSDRLPLFVSATCEFTRFDDPELVSAGEWMSLNPIGGAIAMMTTTRTVSYSINTNTISSFFKNVFIREADYSPRTFGEIIMHTKINQTASNIDRMSFVLIGDPALKIALPRYKVVIDSINGLSPNLTQDTLQALSKVYVKAHIEDFNNNLLSNFKGVATATLYDKPKQLQTLGQKPGPGTIGYANVLDFELQKNVIYRGQSTVQNGYFDFEFIVPKDINYSFDNGKFSLYAENGVTDAIGVEQRVIVGGVNPNGLNDDIGPIIDIYLNNENFVDGGLTDETPYLIAQISDENGINTVGNGIGHDIVAIIDGKTSAPIVLNEYYKNDIDSYQSGELRYQLNELEPGRHTLKLKAWDVNNNSSEKNIEFIVQEKANLALEHVLNYPNPFTTHTDFFFEHNQCCTNLDVQIQIFTVSGKLVRTINQSIYTQGYRSEGISWDAKDDFGDQLARGVYIYRLKVKLPNGEQAEKLEKLVLL